MTWQKVPAWTGPVHHGCIHCSDVGHICSLEKTIAVGFGDAYISKDGEIIFNGEQADDFHFLEEFEEIAKADPDHDWRLVLHGPLHGETYQRHGEGQWVLIESNEGFA